MGSQKEEDSSSKRSRVTIWRCDAEYCNAYCHEDENVSPIACGWTSLQFTVSKHFLTVDLCSKHSQGNAAEVLATAVQIAQEKAKLWFGK